ncbi:MAG: hypothetical protein HYY97_14730 [Rhodocyclales bacterium]|nr:hypothetical protein [Rhodocyclales bacterium]
MSQYQTVPLVLAYKGARSYLHGTDMYNAIMEYFGRVMSQQVRGPLKMVMHEFARNQVDLLYSIGAERCPRPENARLEFSLAGDVSGWLNETDRPVRSSRPYPEDEIIAGSRLEERAIIAALGAPCSTIEVLVSLTKHLHTTLLPGATGWAFTKLELQRPLSDDDADDLQVELLNTLGNRLTKSAVRVGSTLLGHIYFSAVGS